MPTKLFEHALPRVNSYYSGIDLESGLIVVWSASATDEEKRQTEIDAYKRSLESVEWRLANIAIIPASPENSPESLANEKQAILTKLESLGDQPPTEPKKRRGIKA
jgi:hypothetical protein